MSLLNGTIDGGVLCTQFVKVAGHFLWQGMLVLALSLTASRLLRGARASVRYRTQLALLMLLVALPVATSLTLWPSAAIHSTGLPVVAVSGVPARAIADHVADLQIVTSETRQPDRWRSYDPLFVQGYGIGVVAFLARLAWALRGGVRLKRHATPLSDADQLAIAGRAAAQIGVRKLPVIGVCAAVVVPTVVGIFKPAILLPPAALLGLTPSQLEAVLAHEFAHLQRRDHLVQLVQRLIESALFFHPAVWIISRRVRIERELCCDELVVQAHGSSAYDYASSLLIVAKLAFAQRQQRRQIASLAAVSGRPSTLRDRIDRLLHPEPVPQFRLGHAWMIAFAIAVVMIGSTASLRFGTRAAAEPAPATKPTVKSIKLTVVDADTNKPIPHATVAIRRDPGKDGSPDEADANGQIDVPMREGKTVYVLLTASADGYATMRASWDAYQHPLDVPESFTLALPKATLLGGVIVDAAGKPVSGATVTVDIRGDKIPAHVSSGVSWRKIIADGSGHWDVIDAMPTWKSIAVGAYDMKRGGNQQGYFGFSDVEGENNLAALRAGEYSVALAPVRLIKGRIVDKDGKPVPGASVGVGEDRVASNSLPSVKADANGHYEIGIIPDANVTLTFKAKDHAPELIRVTNNSNLGDVNQTLQPSQKLTGRIVDTEGKPLAKVDIAIDTWRGARTLLTNLKSDADGRFEWDDAPTDAVLIDVYTLGYADQRDVSVTAGQDNLITLGKPVTFHATVVDAETKKPVTDFTTIIGIIFNETSQPSFDRRNQSEESARTGPGTFDLSFSYPYFGRIVRVEAEGYAPSDSPMIKMSDGEKSFTYELHRAASLTGTVVDANDKPVGDASVMLATAGSPVRLENGAVPEYDLREIVLKKTDAAGHFTIPPQAEDFEVIATSESSGFKRVHGVDLKANPKIALERWASIQGTAKVGSKLWANSEVQGYSISPDEHYDPKAPQVSHALKTKTDAQGHFVIDHVPPGAWGVGRYISVGEQMWTTVGIEKVTIKPGESLTIQVGGNGRPVIGKIELPAELKARTDLVFDSISLATRFVQPPLPKPIEELQAMTEAERKAYSESPEAKAYEKLIGEEEAKVKRYSGKLELNGTFRIDDVVPGTYEISSQIYKRRDGTAGGFGGEMLGRVTGDDVVVAAGDIDQPIDVPPLKVTMKKTIEVGQTVPDFDVPTLDGKHIKLSDLRGKVVLIDFWATWCGPCVAEMPNIKAVFDKHGHDDRFTIVSLSLDPDQKAPTAFAQKHGITWTQGFLGDWNKATLPAEFGVDGIPSLFLIDAEGKLIAKNIGGEGIEKAVAAALSK